MDSWTEGYVADIDYVHGYYAELCPLRLRLAFIYSELAFPAVETACELGFGQGVSVAIHAAASTVHWHGTDFNPAQAAQAQQLAQASGAAPRLSNEAFADFCQRSDLPDFDFIGLHGIWSWVSEENRQTLVRFLQRKLKPGGVVFMSYNTLPGWSAMAPLRHLMVEHLQAATPTGQGLPARIGAAMAFVDQVLAAQPAYLTSAPDVTERLARIRTKDPGYLAHEYFNQAWQPMYFSEVAQWMSRAKLSHACSARYLDHIAALNVTPAQRAVLEQLADSTLRKTVRDFFTNQQFRADYWVKGPRRLSPLEQAEALRDQRLVLVAPRGEVTLQVQGPTGEAGLSPAIYEPVLDVLADHQPHSVAELEAAVAPHGVAIGQLAQAAMVLVGKGSVAPAQSDAEIRAVRGRTDALNRALLHRARGVDLGSLASPVIAGGVNVPRTSMLFLAARDAGHAGPDAWAEEAWAVMSAQGQLLLDAQGQPVIGADENRAQLRRQAQAFAEKQLPLLRDLQVA